MIDRFCLFFIFENWKLQKVVLSYLSVGIGVLTGKAKVEHVDPSHRLQRFLLSNICSALSFIIMPWSEIFPLNYRNVRNANIVEKLQRNTVGFNNACLSSMERLKLPFSCDLYFHPSLERQILKGTKANQPECSGKAESAPWLLSTRDHSRSCPRLVISRLFPHNLVL